MSPKGARTTLVVLSLAASASATAATLTIEETSLQARVAYQHASARAQSISTLSTLEGGFTVRWRESLSLRASAWVESDASGRLRPRDFDERRFDHASNLNRAIDLGSHANLELRDLYLQWQGERTQVRLGKQQVVWGKLDGLRVLDQVHPADFHRFLLLDDARRRLPQWGVHSTHYLPRWSFEALALVDNTVHDIADPGGWFAFRAPRLRYGFSGDSVTESVGVRSDLPDPWSDLTLGARASRQVGVHEIAFVAKRGHDFEGIGELRAAPADAATASSLLLVRQFPRQDLLGASWESSLGRVVMRAELAFQPQRRFNVRDTQQQDLSTTRANQWLVGLALDADLPFGILASTQLLLDRVVSASPGLVRPQEDWIATLSLRRKLRYDALQVQLRYLGDLRVGDGMIDLGLRYAINDRIALALRHAQFHGDATGLFGQFADRDLVELRVEASL
ncbi:MAG: DUF1302 family protein [Pseudomonadota bacterium]